MERQLFRASFPTRQSGFTLLEAVISLVLVGLIAAGAISLAGYSAQILNMGQKTTMTLPQIAAGLNTVETILKYTPLPVTETSDVYTAYSSTNNTYTPVTLQLKDRQLLLNSVVLLNNVLAFSVQETSNSDWKGFTDMHRYTVNLSVRIDDVSTPINFSFTVMSSAHKKEALL